MKQIERFGAALLRYFGKEKDPFSSFSSKGEENLKELLLADPLSQLLPYHAYDVESGLFINKESAGFIIEALPLMGADDTVQKEITGIFQELLEEGSSMQCMLIADHRIESFLDQWAAPRIMREGIFEQLAQRRLDYFRKMQETSTDVPPRLFRFILSYSSPREEILNPMFIQKLKDTKERILKILSSFTYAFSWDAQQFIETIDGIINFEMHPSSFKRKWNPLEDLSYQLPIKGGSLEISPDHLSWNRNERAHFKSFHVCDFPEMWSNYSMQKLIGDLYKEPFRIPCPFYIHYGVYCPPQGKEESALNRKMQFVENQGKSATLLKMIPELAEELRDFDFVRRQVRQGEKLVWTQLSCGIWYTQENERKAEQSIHSLFRINQFRLAEPKFGHLLQYLSSLPMAWGHSVSNLRQLGFLKTSLALETGNFVPIQGEWWGTHSPGVLLTGRRGQLLSWNPFDNKNGNYNVVVIGRSGSGKSVFMQDLLMSSLSTGSRVFVLDVGRSFEKMCYLVDGQYIEFSQKTPLCLNPFTHIPVDDSEARDMSFSMIKSILATMAAPKKGTTDLENALLEKALRSAYEIKKNKTTISDVAKWLIDQENPGAQNLGMMLIGYTLEGSYARFFEGENNVSFNRSMVLIELEELKEQKDLQAVVLQMVMMAITNQTFLGDRKQPFLICIDEAWDLLRSPQTGLFIETLARRLRKYNGSLVVGTQSVDDFYQAPGALAAFENSDWMCFLSQKRSSIARLKESKKIDLDGDKEAALQSLSTKQGDYSEVMICDAEGFHSICRFKLDPFSALLYSTKAEEYSRLKELCNTGKTVTQAIEQILAAREART